MEVYVCTAKGSTTGAVSGNPVRYNAGDKFVIGKEEGQVPDGELAHVGSVERRKALPDDFPDADGDDGAEEEAPADSQGGAEEAPAPKKRTRNTGSKTRG